MNIIICIFSEIIIIIIIIIIIVTDTEAAAAVSGGTGRRQTRDWDRLPRHAMETLLSPCPNHDRGGRDTMGTMDAGTRQGR